jgi:hypothetical protein
MGVARKIRDLPGLGDMALYAMNPELEGHRHVIVCIHQGSHVFPASGPNDVVPSSWEELPGSGSCKSLNEVFEKINYVKC